ncbi:uncharacterized protein [Chelonus insularis]|uniref:uncharacterized protein n=1 Tax=Chelonus insularis TaxID=460826 RepID=UPI00158DF1DF|nr:uncharacterized protein LOC118068719 [Chelonus insularis]
MGNHVTRHNNGLAKKHMLSPANNQPTTPLSRNASASEIEQNFVTHFKPIDKLTKILAERTQHEDDSHGISEKVFVKYLFPHYSNLGSRLFKYLHAASKASSKHLGTSAFKQQIEKLLSIMNDQTILDVYVKMFSTTSKEDGDITSGAFKELLMTSYQLATDCGPNSCIFVHDTIEAVVSSCFHGKECLSTNFISNWLWSNCPRIVYGVHRYIIHVFSTAYRNGQALLSTEELQPHIEPVTPVLEKAISFEKPETLLPLSHVWLLSITLPFCYIQAEDLQADESSSALKMSRTPCPSHWTLLYNSDEHGTGANRFLHHILGYRGPTIVFIQGDSGNNEFATYCICSAIEWRESHLYWGNEDSVIIELKPLYRLVEKGPKLLYLNTSIRGYPQGLRAGKDTRNPFINIDQAFNSVSFGGAPHKLVSIVVWGCGDVKSREQQLEIKKWQVKEAEKQRVVKLSTADWLDHPDRYLLELAGRPSYNNGGS